MAEGKQFDVECWRSNKVNSMVKRLINLIKQILERLIFGSKLTLQHLLRRHLLAQVVQLGLSP